MKYPLTKSHSLPADLARGRLDLPAQDIDLPLPAAPPAVPQAPPGLGQGHELQHHRLPRPRLGPRDLQQLPGKYSDFILPQGFLAGPPKPSTGARMYWRYIRNLHCFLSSLNKRRYQLTVLLNSAYFRVCLWLSEPKYCVCLFIIILMLWQSCTKSDNKLIRRSQQAKEKKKR